jgi:hypothetical protein
MTVNTMLDSMPSDELTYWMAYFTLENEDRERAEMASKVKSDVRR